jgi:hypothetical protein
VGVDTAIASAGPWMRGPANIGCPHKPTANQIEFVNMIVDHLTDRGVMEPRLL